MKTLLHLTDPVAIKRLGGFFRSLELIPVDGQRVRVDSTLLQDLATDPASMSAIYQQNPNLFRRLIVDDATARDLVALDHRRQQVKHFRKLLGNGQFFDSEAIRLNGKEAVWQNFFEQNPWILGAVTPGQLFTAWDKKKLERTVVGASIAFPGKRVDALLHTSGVVRSLVFAEFKTHRTTLLGKEYRSGCFAPSDELAGGVSQVQGTVHWTSPSSVET